MEESELELSLGLSIGGSFRKVEERAKSTPSLSTFGDAQFDPEEKKREIHALRRQEAKRKREDKKKRGRTAVGSVDYDNNNNGSNDNESDGGFEAVMKKRLCGNQEEILGSGIQMQVTSSVPALPVQFGQFPNAHFVNYGNGFVFPYHMVPCWGPVPATGEEKSEKNVYYPVACRPLEALPIERENGGEVKSGESSGAAASSSSAVSESRNGMSSSRETSHSVESKSLKRNAEAQSDQRATDDASQVVEEQKNAHKNNTSSLKTNTNANKPMENLIQRKAEEEEEEEESNPVHKPPPPPPVLPLMKKSNGGRGGGGESNKPPRPQSKLPLLRSQSLPPMPCVSTTGDGPNGKKINGFLYKYNKTEVSIMCVCHGTSFTPAEFVKHAGGTDVSHPLKHIVVVPSAF